MQIIQRSIKTEDPRKYSNILRDIRELCGRDCLVFSDELPAALRLADYCVYNKNGNTIVVSSSIYHYLPAKPVHELKVYMGMQNENSDLINRIEKILESSETTCQTRLTKNYK